MSFGRPMNINLIFSTQNPVHRILCCVLCIYALRPCTRWHRWETGEQTKKKIIVSTMGLLHHIHHHTRTHSTHIVHKFLVFDPGQKITQNRTGNRTKKEAKEAHNGSADKRWFRFILKFFDWKFGKMSIHCCSHFFIIRRCRRRRRRRRYRRCLFFDVSRRKARDESGRCTAFFFFICLSQRKPEAWEMVVVILLNEQRAVARWLRLLNK